MLALQDRLMRRAVHIAVIALWPSLVQADPIGRLEFVGTVELSQGLTVDGARVGGLSGLDYDAAADSFIAVSDDRSDFAPARFYRMRVRFDGGRLAGVDMLAAIVLRQPDGAPYPNGKQGGDVPDPEAIRIDPHDPASLWWTSEGDRARRLAPFLRVVDHEGKHLGATPVPDMFAMSPGEELGPRNNLAFEGLSFSPDGESLWLAMEGALYQDGPLASPERGTIARFSRLTRDGQMLGQYAYPVDAVPRRPGDGKAADNGVTEILALDSRRLLVVERAAIQGDEGTFRNDIRLYEADIADATDVSTIAALSVATYRPAAKRLIADLGALIGARIDNVEGMSWGPRMADGRRTLIFVSDDNFNPAQVTQILAFAVAE